MTTRTLCDPGEHLPVVTSQHRVRDFFVKSYFLRCWHCDFAYGPLVKREHAEHVKQWMEEGVLE